jgi:hypothetical protein
MGGCVAQMLPQVARKINRKNGVSALEEEAEDLYAQFLGWSKRKKSTSKKNV